MRFAFALVFALSACTAVDRTVSLKPADELVTGSVASANKANGVDPKDAEIIKERVVASPLAFSKPLEWRNDETGASGAIMAIETFRGRHGQPCRSFRTTIANFPGRVALRRRNLRGARALVDLELAQALRLKRFDRRRVLELRARRSHMTRNINVVRG